MRAISAGRKGEGVAGVDLIGVVGFEGAIEPLDFEVRFRGFGIVLEG